MATAVFRVEFVFPKSACYLLNSDVYKLCKLSMSRSQKHIKQSSPKRKQVIYI